MINNAVKIKVFSCSEGKTIGLVDPQVWIAIVVGVTFGSYETAVFVEFPKVGFLSKALDDLDLTQLSRIMRFFPVELSVEIEVHPNLMDLALEARFFEVDLAVGVEVFFFADQRAIRAWRGRGVIPLPQIDVSVSVDIGRYGARMSLTNDGRGGMASDQDEPKGNVDNIYMGT